MSFESSLSQGSWFLMVDLLLGCVLCSRPSLNRVWTEVQHGEERASAKLLAMLRDIVVVIHFWRNEGSDQGASAVGSTDTNLGGGGGKTGVWGPERHSSHVV